MKSTLTKDAKTTKDCKQLYEVNLYVELDYPSVVDKDGNEGSGRYELGLPDWNIIFLTDNPTGDCWEDFKNRFPAEAKRFIDEYEENILDIHLEDINKKEEGYHYLEEDDVMFVENGCVWEAYWDEWEDDDDDDDLE